MANTDKQTQIAEDTKLNAGLVLHASTFPASFTLGNETYTVPAAETILQARIAAANKTLAARAALKQAVLDEQNELAQTKDFVSGLRKFIVVMNSNDAAILSDYGLTVPKKPGVKTVAKKMAAVSKSTLTRKVRHTVGPKQRLEIKGTVEVPSPEAVALMATEGHVATGAGNGGATPGPSKT